MSIAPPVNREDEIALRALLGDVLGHDLSAIGLDEDLPSAFGLDSLDALRLLAAAEKRYGFRFPDDQLSDVRTLRQILQAASGALASGAREGRS